MITGKPQYIMLIDDNEATNYLHNLVIAESGIDVKVLSFTYVEKALENLFLGLAKPGIIFLDINMPGMNGWDFLNEFEKLPPVQKEKTIVVILTTSENPNDLAKGNKNPYVKGFFIKPLTTGTFTNILNSHFNFEK